MGTEIRFTKWGGSLHWHYTMERLGADEHGLWLVGRTGMTLRRGYEEPIRQPHDFVQLVPVEGCWTAAFNADLATTDIEVYVDVTNRPVVEDGVVHAVDLDLDVVRRRNGEIAVLDVDEFVEHRVRYGYPAEVVEQALDTTAELTRMFAAGREPFASAGAAWLASYTATS
jgi:predicted RNA-binding protein associated with RNAse of E/G family